MRDVFCKSDYHHLVYEVRHLQRGVLQNQGEHQMESYKVEILKHRVYLRHT